jgi:NADH dehydrogenase
VAGDLGHLVQDGKPLPGVAQVAIQQGKHAAKNVWRSIEGLKTEPFRYRDPGSMATIGRAAAVAQIGPIAFAGLPAWLAWLFVHILWLIGFQNRLLVLTQWAWAYFSYHRGARLITGERHDAALTEPQPPT